MLLVSRVSKTNGHPSFLRTDKPAPVTKIGYVIPVGIFSAIFLSVGSGLYSLLQPGSSTGKWVGFQILGGIGSGAGLQLVCPRLTIWHVCHFPGRPWLIEFILGYHFRPNHYGRRGACIRHRFLHVLPKLWPNHCADPYEYYLQLHSATRAP